MKREGQISVNSKNMFPIIKKWLYSDKDIFLERLFPTAVTQSKSSSACAASDRRRRRTATSRG